MIEQQERGHNEHVRTFGDTLRQARLDKGVSLDEAAEATRIRRRYLEALETEESGGLPAPIYTRGFVRTYADYLGLNAQAIVDLYVPLPKKAPSAPLRPALPRVAIPRQIPLRPILSIGGVLVGVLLVAYVWMQLQVAADAFRAEQGLPSARAGAATLPPRIPTPNPIVLLSPEPTTLPTALPTVAPTATAEPPAPTPTAAPAGILVEFRTTSPVYVEAAVDGQRVLAETLPAGITRALPLGNERVIMRVSNGSAVEVMLNGKRQEPPEAQAPVEFEWRW